MSKFSIFPAGIAVAGMGYPLLQAILEPPVLFVVVVIYAVALRLLTEKLGRRWRSPGGRTCSCFPSRAAPVWVAGGLSMGTMAAMGEALHGVSSGAGNPERAHRSVPGENAPRMLLNNPNRTACGCRRK